MAKIKSNNVYLALVRKMFVGHLLAGHHFHWICLITILMLSIAGNCYQLYHAIAGLKKNVNKIDMTYPANYSVPSITFCFPVISLLNMECLRQKKPFIMEQLIIKNLNNSQQYNQKVMREFYLEVIRSEKQMKLILNGFYVNELYQCLDKPRFHMVNDSSSVITLKNVVESFKADLFCPTLHFNQTLVSKYLLIRKTLLKSLLKINISINQLKYVQFVKLYLHDAHFDQNDYLLWYYKLIYFDFTVKHFKNIFGVSYSRFSNTLEEDCTPNNQFSYHYTSKKFYTSSHMAEDCLNRDFISVLHMPYGDTRLTSEFIRKPRLKLKLYKPSRSTFENMNKIHNLTRLIDNCDYTATQRACYTSIFLPKLRYAYHGDQSSVTFVLVPPREPELEVKSAPRLSTFEFAIFIVSMICCWLQFSVVGFVYSLITFEKNLKQIKRNLGYQRT